MAILVTVLFVLLLFRFLSFVAFLMSSDEEDLDLNDEGISQIDNNSDGGEAMDTEGKLQKAGKHHDVEGTGGPGGTHHTHIMTYMCLSRLIGPVLCPWVLCTTTFSARTVDQTGHSLPVESGNPHL